MIHQRLLPAFHRQYFLNKPDSSKDCPCKQTHNQALLLYNISIDVFQSICICTVVSDFRIFHIKLIHRSMSKSFFFRRKMYFLRIYVYVEQSFFSITVFMNHIMSKINFLFNIRIKVLCTNVSL